MFKRHLRSQGDNRGKGMTGINRSSDGISCTINNLHAAKNVFARLFDKKGPGSPNCA
jgi:hypothetical protein